jgi:hypothetical protein
MSKDIGHQAFNVHAPAGERVFHNGEWTCLKMGYQLIDPED